MTKETLARFAAQMSWQAGKERFDISVVSASSYADIEFCDKMKAFVESAAGAADTKLIKGKITLKGYYLVSRGKELHTLKQRPNAVAEYSRHWPYDYCYFYKI